MKHAAFQATYSDWRLIKTRKVVQIVFEVPVEQAGLAYEVLDGMPNFGSEVWCAIARLKPEVKQQPRPTAPDTPTGGAHHKSWHEMAPAQQAGILCGERPFQEFIRARMGDRGLYWEKDKDDQTVTAILVREICGVKSRSEIRATNTSGNLWANLVSDYRAWMREPEVVG